MKFKATHLNVITEVGDKGSRSLIVHVELDDDSSIEGGEALSVAIQETDDLDLLNDQTKFTMYIKHFDQKEVIDRIQTLIDASGATSWQELRNYLTQYFRWI